MAGRAKRPRLRTSTVTAVSTSCPETTGTKDPHGPGIRSGSSTSRTTTSTISATFRSTWTATAIPTSCRSRGSRRRSPGGRTRARRAGMWAEADIDSGFPIEFALLVGSRQRRQGPGSPAAGRIDADAARVVRGQGRKLDQACRQRRRVYGHGIGAGDVNKDGRTDILTPRGWAEAPADPRSGPGRSIPTGRP